MSELQPMNEITPSRKESGASFGGDNIDDVILNGVTFKGAAKGPRRDETGKVRTKAKKKAYIMGAHGSAAAKKKADIRRSRQNRHKGK